MMEKYLSFRFPEVMYNDKEFLNEFLEVEINRLQKELAMDGLKAEKIFHSDIYHEEIKMYKVYLIFTETKI